MQRVTKLKRTFHPGYSLLESKQWQLDDRTFFVITSEVYDHPTMCAEFDPDAGKTYVDHHLYITRPYGWFIFDKKNKEDVLKAKKLKTFLRNYSLISIDDKKLIHNSINNWMLYKDLSSKAQESYDKRNNQYPSIEGKYFITLHIPQIQKIIQDIKDEVGSNLNDWKIYGDRIPEDYSIRKSKEVDLLNQYINKLSDVRKWMYSVTENNSTVYINDFIEEAARKTKDKEWTQGIFEGIAWKWINSETLIKSSGSICTKQDIHSIVDEYEDTLIRLK